MATETTDLAAARAALARLADGRRVRMCIPPQPGDDDMILGRALDELAALRDVRAALISDLIHVARTSHQDHHADHSGTWLSCDRGLCPGLRRAVSRARGEG